MRRARKRKQEQTENDERWLITYSDLITLLLIFFIVLYAMSNLDATKYRILSQSLQLEFHKANNVLDAGNGVLDGMKGASSGAAQQKPTKQQEQDPQQQATTLQEKELQNLLTIIQKYIQDNKLQNKVFVTDVSKGISIRLNDLFLFDSGKADLKKESEPVLNKLSSLFSSLPNTISIEGHTDNTPVNPGGPYVDNWELSTARSLSVLHFFIGQAKLKPSQFEISGYADTRPVAPNDTKDHLQQNRRVEITILRIGEKPSS